VCRPNDVGRCIDLSVRLTNTSTCPDPTTQQVESRDAGLASHKLPPTWRRPAGAGRLTPPPSVGLGNLGRIHRLQQARQQPVGRVRRPDAQSQTRRPVCKRPGRTVSKLKSTPDPALADGSATQAGIRSALKLSTDRNQGVSGPDTRRIHTLLELTSDPTST